MNILSLTSRQPWRITLAADATPSTTATDYVVARKDGGYSSIEVTKAWLIAPTTVELALSAPLDDGFAFTVSMPNSPGAPSSVVAYRAPLAPPAALPDGEDPEAEAYGVDADWLRGSFTGDGDLVEVRGRQCMLNDTLTIALIDEGEIFHRPNDGIGLPRDVNGPATTARQSAMRGRMRRQWLKDDRIATVESIDFTIDSGGKIYPKAKLTDAVSGEQFDVIAPSGNT